MATAPLQSGSDPQESLQLFTQRRDSDKEPRAVCKGSQSLCLWRSSLGLVWHQNLTLEADHRRILNSFITGSDKQWRSAAAWRPTPELPRCLAHMPRHWCSRDHSRIAWSQWSRRNAKPTAETDSKAPTAQHSPQWDTERESDDLWCQSFQSPKPGQCGDTKCRRSAFPFPLFFSIHFFIFSSKTPRRLQLMGYWLMILRGHIQHAYSAYMA